MAEPRVERAAASPTHAALFAALHDAAMTPAWNEAAFATLLAQPGVSGWIGSLDNEPAGLLLARCVAGEAEILALAVRPAFRRRGIARALLGALFEAVAAQDVARIFLEVAESNAAARALYTAQGFVPVGRRAAYYGINEGSDALVLARIGAPTAR